MVILAAEDNVDGKTMQVIITMILGVLFIIGLVIVAYKYRHSDWVGYLRVSLFIMLGKFSYDQYLAISYWNTTA